MSIIPLTLALIGACTSPCADGYGRDSDGNCVLLETETPGETGSTSPDDTTPLGETGEGETDDTLTDDSSDSGEVGAWFSPLSGTPNVLYITLDTQRADALLARWDELPGWFTDVGVDFPLFFTPSSHTSESAPWMLTGCDMRDGPSQRAQTEEEPFPQPIIPAGCETLPVTYAAMGYETLLISGNYTFLNGTWYDAQTIRQSGVGAGNWDQELGDAIAAMSEPWAVTFWVQGSRMPFLTLDGDRCENAPLGYSLGSAQGVNELEQIYTTLSDEQIATVRESMACAYGVDTEHIVRGLAEALDALKDAGRLDDAVIVFTDDHGELLLDYTDAGYPPDYTEAQHWSGHGNALYGHESTGYGKVWFSGADTLQTVERASGSPDLLQLLYYLTGASRDGLRGALPWRDADPVVQRKNEHLGVAWTDAETGISYRYVEDTGRDDGRLFDLQADPGEFVDLLASGAALDPEIAAVLDQAREQLEADTASP